MRTNEIIKYVSDGFIKAKAGNAMAIYTGITKIFNAGDLPEKSYYPYGWIIYYALHQCPAHEIKIRKEMLANYLMLHLIVPHKLHSMILQEATRLYKDAVNAAYGKKKG